jgi:hypothetical protein
MVYTILPYTKQKAKELGVSVKPSTNSNKKIDVFKNDKKIATIGATGYKDFPTYTKEKGLNVALERQRLYRLRHAKDMKNIGSNGYFAGMLLW